MKLVKRGRNRNAELGARLLKARTTRSLTLRALSKRTGVSESSLSRFESGISAPSFADVCAIARALGYPLLYFASGHERTGSDPRHLTAHLRFWGFDLPADALIGESRPFEELVVESLRDSSTPRIIEGIPALLLRNDFDRASLEEIATARDSIVRVGWACELAEWLASKLRLDSIRPDAVPRLRAIRTRAFKLVKPVWDIIGEGEAFEEGYEGDPSVWLESAIKATPELTKKWWLVFETKQERFLERAKEILTEAHGG